MILNQKQFSDEVEDKTNIISQIDEKQKNSIEKSSTQIEISDSDFNIRGFIRSNLEKLKLNLINENKIEVMDKKKLEEIEKER